MDSNKERALKAKEEAEVKFAENDYVGAKLFALAAKDLCPELGFISLFITVIDIYLSFEKIKIGEADWHGVLGLEQSATVDEICGRFYDLYEDVKAVRKCVVGAEGALPIITEAFCLLTETFWTRCSSCRFRFQYSKFRMNKVLLCYNCHGSFLAVPLSPENYPTEPKTMNNFPRRDTSPVLALPAILASEPVADDNDDDDTATDDDA